MGSECQKLVCEDLSGTPFTAFKSMKSIVISLKKKNNEDKSYYVYLISKNSIINFTNLIEQSRVFDNLFLQEFTDTDNGYESDLKESLNDYKLDKNIKFYYKYEECQEILKNNKEEENEFIIVNNAFIGDMGIKSENINKKGVWIYKYKDKSIMDIKFSDSDNIMNIHEKKVGFYTFISNENNNNEEVNHISENNNNNPQYEIKNDNSNDNKNGIIENSLENKLNSKILIHDKNKNNVNSENNNLLTLNNNPSYNIYKKNSRNNKLFNNKNKTNNLKNAATNILNNENNIQDVNIINIENMPHNIDKNKNNNSFNKDETIKINESYIQNNNSNFDKNSYKSEDGYIMEVSNNNLINKKNINNNINSNNNNKSDINSFDGGFIEASINDLNIQNNNNNNKNNNIINQNNNNQIKDNNNNNINNNDKNNSNNRLIQEIQVLKEINDYKNPTLIGLTNIKDTYYMNPTIQCLSNIPSLTNYFLLNKEKFSSIPEQNEEKKISKTFSEVIYNLWNEKNIKGFYNPEYFKEIIKKEISKNNIKNNLKELILYLYQHIHDELNEMDKKNNVPNYNSDQTDPLIELNKCRNNFKIKNKSIITDIFYFDQVEILKCLKCRISTYNFSMHNALFFPLENVLSYLKNKSFALFNDITIYECLDYHTNKNSKNKMICKSCNQLSNFESCIKISSLPEILTIFLTKGEDQLTDEFKISYYIESLSQFLFNLSDSNDEGKKYKYELIGIVISEGVGENVDNYFTFCKSPVDKKWYSYNNEKVEYIEDVTKKINEIPYLLFYQKIKK